MICLYRCGNKGLARDVGLRAIAFKKAAAAAEGCSADVIAFQ
jgi:hypothetical protein